jgi:hypothetical protein
MSMNTSNSSPSLRTNASPVYLVLLISATYFSNRQCVYCSLLLFILVVALVDFQTPWFEAPLPETLLDSAANATSPLGGNSVGETAAVVFQAASQTTQALAKAALDGVRERTEGSSAVSYQWAKALMGKKEWRVPCLDVLVRI